MRFRLNAFRWHLTGSACVMALVLGALYAGWYRWPGWYLTDAATVALIMIAVDVCLGPLCTLIIAAPGKPSRELARDVGIIVAVQVAGLLYGAATLWQGRPLYYAFSVDRLQIVQASELSPAETALARRQNPAFAPQWDSTPRWVWAPLPDDKKAQEQIMRAALFGGDDVIQMPRFFKPWDAGRPELQKQLKKVDSLIMFSRKDRERLKQQMAARGLPADRACALYLTGKGKPLLAVLDPATLRIEAMLRAN